MWKIDMYMYVKSVPSFNKDKQTINLTSDFFQMGNTIELIYFVICE